MKWILALMLFIPCLLSAQTAHITDDKVEYKDKVKIDGLSQAQIFDRIQAAVKKYVHPTSKLKTEEDKKELKVDGEITLATPYAIIRKVQYALKISVNSNGYEYKIDDVNLWEKHRGDEAKIIASKDIVDQMGDSGNPAIKAEQVLNAMDMYLQKLLTQIENRVKG